MSYKKQTSNGIILLAAAIIGISIWLGLSNIKPTPVIINPTKPNPLIPMDTRRVYNPMIIAPPQRDPINTSYDQLGILTRDDVILPLFGKQLHRNQKWNYYTMSDKQVSVKLPVVRNNKSCTGEYGCDELFSGDMVLIHGYEQAFKVLIYDTNTWYSPN
jgi:hypothetical protein